METGGILGQYDLIEFVAANYEHTGIRHGVSRTLDCLQAPRTNATRGDRKDGRALLHSWAGTFGRRFYLLL